VRPYFSEIEWVVGHFRGVGLRHDLNLERPLREVAFFDALVEVALMALAILADDRLGFLIGQVLDALLALEVELDPVALVVRVDEAERVTGETMHVAISGGDAAVAHDDGDLVQGLGQ